jgi:hypothetical protein
MLKGLRLLRGLPRNQGCAHTLACGIVHLQSPRQPVRCILIDHAGRALGPHEPSRPGRIPGGRMRVDGKQQLCFLTRAEAVRKEIALKSPDVREGDPLGAGNSRGKLRKRGLPAECVNKEPVGSR